MAQLSGYAVGDVVWIAWVHIEQRFKGTPVTVQPFVNRAIVVNGDLDVVSTDNGMFPPRTLYSVERVFRTEVEGRRHCAQVAADAASTLAERAVELFAAADAAVPDEAEAV